MCLCCDPNNGYYFDYVLGKHVKTIGHNDDFNKKDYAALLEERSRSPYHKKTKGVPIFYILSKKPQLTYDPFLVKIPIRSTECYHEFFRAHDYFGAVIEINPTLAHLKNHFQIFTPLMVWFSSYSSEPSPPPKNLEPYVKFIEHHPQYCKHEPCLKITIETVFLAKIMRKEILPGDFYQLCREKVIDSHCFLTYEWMIPKDFKDGLRSLV